MIRTSLLRITIRSRIKILPTSTGQKKAVWMNFWILSSRLARFRRDLDEISDKNQDFEENLPKKCVSKSENPKKLWFSSKCFSLLFLQILMFLDMKLQDKIKIWAKSKRKFKNSSIRTRTDRPKFDYFSSNFSKNLWNFDALPDPPSGGGIYGSAHCRVTPYRGENLSLLLHTSETRSLPRIAVKR